ncbi:unnamed protein product, partial [Rotaria socialis]
MSGDRKQIILP